jgi:DeoR/GlpR family transcriptional regulator of sugar metabolism
MRQVDILDAIREETTVRVRDLAGRFEVSESTIRRDLDELAAQGLVRRVYGGAVLEPHLQSDPPFELRQISHAKEKDMVGRAAAHLVRDGETVFLDGGTTTQFIVPYLQDRKNLTVVTCGLNVASALVNYPHITTVGIGGVLHVESQSFAGPLALELLDIYAIRCDRAFISAGGVSAKYGVTNRILDRIPLKRKAMEISREVAVVVDGSKVGVVTLGRVAPTQAAQYLITDLSAPAEELEEIARLGVVIKTMDEHNTPGVERRLAVREVWHG